jgi:hypothetical protein
MLARFTENRSVDKRGISVNAYGAGLRRALPSPSFF